MDVRELASPDPVTPPLGESRSRVLAVLQDAGEPVGVGAVARRVRLHPNTVRFHLDALVDAGLAERDTEEPDRPGRPRTLYSAHAGAAPAGQRSYRLLTQILAGFIAAQIPQPAQAATRAGQAWGRYLADRPPPFRSIDVETATEQLSRTLSAIGFASETVISGTERQIMLHHCPFREAAIEHREVVCSIHLGLMQGMLAELDAPIEADRLDPFVEPNLCIAHLAATDQDDRRQQGAAP
ncbi:MAG TPA: helix-turn-helix domain-containing protein [Jiangellaceae bacterium]